MITKKQKNMIKKEVACTIRSKDCATLWPHGCPFDEISGDDCGDCDSYRTSLKVIEKERSNGKE